MRRIYLILVATLIAVSMSAQMRIWENGKVMITLDLTKIDSITFVKSGQDTVTPVDPDTTATPSETISFNYNHWREVTKVKMFISDNGGYWDSISLPWAPTSVTSIDSAYRKPNEEEKWELAFNMLSDPSLEGAHMFGLWDRKAALMRIYAYLENQPASANYCFLQVTSSSTSFIDRDLMTWMPSDSLFRKSNWNNQALSADRVPSTQTCQIMPITGTLNGQVNRGWLCFDMNFSAGNHSIPIQSTINFTLYAVENMDFSGLIEIDEYMKTQSGTITIPGNNNKEAGAWCRAVGSIFSGIGTGVATAFGKEASPGEIVGGALQIGGACFSFIGDGFYAYEEGEDMVYNIDLSFHTTGTDKFHGTLSQTTSTNMPPVTMEYGELFKEVIAHSNDSSASLAPRRSKKNTNPDYITIGAWNLKNQPVLYVCNNAGFITPDNTALLFASFLDPSSIELDLNEDNIMFNIDDVDTVRLIAYDFAFVGDGYTMDNKPYYDFYGIAKDTITYDNIRHMPIPCGEEGYKSFLLDSSATYQTYTRDAAENSYNTYTGVTTDLPSEYGMDVYNLVFTPIIGQHRFLGKLNDPFSRIGVSVVLELTFKNGEKRIFAERFLPQIKAFDYTQAQALKDSLQNIEAPITVDNIALEMPLFDMQKQKALRVLDNMPRANQKYTILPIEEGYGLRVREYQDENTPGVVIVTKHSGNHYKESVLLALHNYLNSLHNWDYINLLLESNDMYSLNNWYVCSRTLSTGCFNIQLGTSIDDYQSGYSIDIYHEDADGNLTLVSYDSTGL